MFVVVCGSLLSSSDFQGSAAGAWVGEVRGVVLDKYQTITRQLLDNVLDNIPDNHKCWDFAYAWRSNMTIRYYSVWNETGCGRAL